MCQCGFAVSAVFLFVIGPPGLRAFPTNHNSQSPPKDLLSTEDIKMTTDLANPQILWIDDPATSLSVAESIEEQQGYTYSTDYNAHSTVNFQDIYSNSMALLAEETAHFTTSKDDETFHLKDIPTQIVQFHLQAKTIPATTPPPLYLLNYSALLKSRNDQKNEKKVTTSSTSSIKRACCTTTAAPEETSISVIPIPANAKVNTNYQRGVLDLLFPAARVKSFKSIFDTIRRVLSHTFR